MNVILALVASTDGKTTNGADGKTYHWNSPEDQKHFQQVIAENEVIIMGRKTYEDAKDSMTLSPDKLRIVMTHNPENFQQDAVAGQLEFTDLSPKELIQRLESEGKQKVLLASGAGLNGLFLEAGLVDQLWITLEPLLFGSGNGMLSSIQSEIALKLISVEQLNSQGTLLLKYQVL